jgi:hypothetical protein
MGVRPQILMLRDASDCEILCYDRAVIPMMALFQPSPFIFFLLKKQFDRIRSTMPVQFSPVCNFHQHPAFPSRYDRDHVCLLDRSSEHLDHLPFPDMTDFNEDIADKIRQWVEIPPCSHCGAVLLRGMSHEFCCKPFAGRIRTECFAGICGYWRHHMKPTVHVLGIHLPGQKTALTSGPDDTLGKIDISSPLERYFGHPIDSSYDQLTDIDYHSRYSVDASPASCNVNKDVCEPARFANPRKNSTICILRSFTHGCMNFLP